MMKKISNHLMNNSLYRNSIYLMTSTFVMAILGFLFWIINARLYLSEQIVLATTLISVTLVMISFSLLGINIAFIHYLPKTNKKNVLVNTGLILISITFEHT